MAKKIVSDLNLKGKTVLMRVDFSIPLKGSGITNDNRTVQALPTIQYIIERGDKIVSFSHSGKVKEKNDKTKLTLHSVAEGLSKKLDKEAVFVLGTHDEKPEATIKDLKEGGVLLAENTCYEYLDSRKESKDDPELDKYRASLGNILIDDTSDAARRKHVSNVGIFTHLETVVGFLTDKEVKFVSGVASDSHKPVVTTLDGAKVPDKINVIRSSVNIANKIITGGGMTYALLKAQDKEVGISLLEGDKVDFAEDLLEKHGDKIALLVGARVTKEFSNDAKVTVVPSDSIPADQEGTDAGPNAVKLFVDELKGAHAIVWNGPMDVFELSNSAQDTAGVCKAIISLKDAIAIIGGGDSAATVISLGLKDNFTRISTGDGASLEYLEGRELPGVKATSNK